MDSFRLQRESEVITRTFYQKLQRAMDVEIDRIVREIKRQIPQKMQAVKSEILGSYNKDIFKFDTTLKNNERAFNQNVRQYASFRNTLEDPEFYTIEEETAYEEDSNPFDEAFDNITEENTRDYNIFSPHNKQNQQGGYASLTETFEKARNIALDEFEKEYITHIKPRILKKYGIKLG